MEQLDRVEQDCEVQSIFTQDDDKTITELLVAFSYRLQLTTQKPSEEALGKVDSMYPRNSFFQIARNDFKKLGMMFLILCTNMGGNPNYKNTLCFRVFLRKILGDFDEFYRCELDNIMPMFWETK